MEDGDCMVDRRVDGLESNYSKEVSAVGWAKERAHQYARRVRDGGHRASRLCPPDETDSEKHGAVGWVSAA
ncbi:hypothetical protein BwSH20_18820 [Bradyrhizobium ottawaense]|nr:hypothetical protein SG09_02760 [Bradyrhizobium ottawaense]GMO13701.1 hypothetical protein BwSF21_00730 [Bradyrhizobium ottawaense]GMO18696.1 hypothetical protein BwSF12_06770 [Bradyrhizobium ottawaense]GMO31503.1 hypothetical protein BwSH14_34250 [Bradyrhizobium ottawaense]GMO58390.1 hypothetical protein BwSG20_10870 [Bradyrhizobium ottawaense]